MTAFDVRIESQANQALVRIVGDLDISSVPKVKAQLSELLEQGAENFLIDLTGVGHVDTTGLGFLVWVRKRATERQGKLLLAGQNAHFRKLLTLTGLATLFELHDELAEAQKVMATLSATGGTPE